MATTLTTAQIKQFRRDIGDTTQPPDLCDEDLQDAYDRADGGGCERVYALMQRLAKHIPKTPQYEQIQGLITLWRQVDGCYGPMRVGTIDLGLDTECEEL